MALPLHALGLAVVFYLSAKILVWRLKREKLPPGPPKLPLVDNLHNIPSGMDFVKFKELGKQYNSDIIHFSALGSSIVVLNSYKAVQELFEQRSSIYSSRATSVMLNELCDFSAMFTFTVYGDLWRVSRRIFTDHFGLTNTDPNQPKLESFYFRRFLCHLLDEPNEVEKHISHLVGSLSISMTYGIKAQPKNDPYIDSSEETVQYMSATAAGIWLVDVIPLLKYIPSWVPGMGFQKVASKCRRLFIDSRETLFETARKSLESSDRRPSFVSEALRDVEGAKDAAVQENLVRNIASTIYLATVETTSSVLCTFFLAMVMYPEVQKKARDELDSVLNGKLPELGDIESLPYLTALVMEVLRWEPAMPCAIPHATTADDIYEGYHIPKDSIVVPNSWAMLMDPEAYPDPLNFKPERFLKAGEIDTSVRNPIDLAFGYGRRICPGRHIALSAVKLTIASVLCTMDIVKRTDVRGKTIEPTREYTPTFVRRPVDMKCVVKPRSALATQLISDWVLAEGSSPP